MPYRREDFRDPRTNDLFECLAGAQSADERLRRMEWLMKLNPDTPKSALKNVDLSEADFRRLVSEIEQFGKPIAKSVTFGDAQTIVPPCDHCVNGWSHATGTHGPCAVFALAFLVLFLPSLWFALGCSAPM